MSMRVSDWERENYEKYGGKFYKADHITVVPSLEAKDFSSKLARIRMDLTTPYMRGTTVLDLCCGTGEYLMFFAPMFKEGKGLDFSAQFIEKANQTKQATGIPNVEFSWGNARQMPFDDQYFDLVYSFASLYHIPRVDQVISEIGRVLKPNGKCVVDLGNLYSLNTIVCNAYPHWAHPYHISVPAMKLFFRGAGLTILQHRAFQFLPLWGADRPKWLKPLLWNGWSQWFTKEFRGKMLDEWISNLPGLNLLAFRHVFVCEKR